MNDTKFEITRKAFKEFDRLLDQAAEVRKLFAAAGLSLPDPLATFVGEASLNGASHRAQPQLSVTPPTPPPRPAEYSDGWIWIGVGDLMATGCVLGILRLENKPLAPKDLYPKVAAIHPAIGYGTMANIGSRLSDSLIHRTNEGWALVDKSRAPVLFEKYAWGPIEIFSKHELAAHRRVLILHILSATKTGLQIVQLVEHLSNPLLCHAPVNKDLVKEDLKVLQEENAVRRVGKTRKWVVSETR
jgi:hypothetical protein